MAASKSLYQQAVSISTEYLGPTGERFMARQVMTHLGKEPKELHERDIPKLTEWVKLTFALLTDDTELVESFARELGALARQSKKRASGVRDA